MIENEEGEKLIKIDLSLSRARSINDKFFNNNNNTIAQISSYIENKMNYRKEEKKFIFN